MAILILFSGLVSSANALFETQGAPRLCGTTRTILYRAVGGRARSGLCRLRRFDSAVLVLEQGLNQIERVHSAVQHSRKAGGPQVRRPIPRTTNETPPDS